MDKQTYEELKELHRISSIDLSAMKLCMICDGLLYDVVEKETTNVSKIFELCSELIEQQKPLHIEAGKRYKVITGVNVVRTEPYDWTVVSDGDVVKIISLEHDKYVQVKWGNMKFKDKKYYVLKAQFNQHNFEEVKDEGE